jgi:hypothetical protein
MNERYRLPLVAGVAVVAIVAVLAAVVGLGSVGSSAQAAATTRPPSAAPMPTGTPAPTPTDPRLTPEGATRAFFAAYSQARKTDDPSIVEPYVTSKDSNAYLSVSSFLGGELAVNRASIVTVERLDGMTSKVTGDTAIVDFDYTEGGYNINPTTGAATETQSVLAPAHVTATLKLVQGRWLVDSYTSLT